MPTLPPSISDEALRAAILERLSTDQQAACAGLRVGVLNGIAHLAGAVDSLEARLRAEEQVREVAGVRGVVNRIEAPGAPSPARIVNLDLDQNEERKSDE